MLLRKVLLLLFLGVTLGATPLGAQLTGGSGSSGLPSASGSGQCIVSTGPGHSYVAGSCGTGNLPALGAGGTVLFQNAAGTAAAWVACTGDATCSAITPGALSVVALRGNPVKAGTLTDAQTYLYNATNGDIEGVSFSGDMAVTNSGAASVLGTHLLASLPVVQGGTGANAAGITAANNIGALATNNALSEIAAAGSVTQSIAQSNLGLSALANKPLPLDIPYGGLNSATQPTSGQIPIANLAGSGYVPETVSGDVSLTNTGAATVGSTHITGVSVPSLAQFNSQGNIVPYAGSGPLGPHTFANQLSAPGTLSGLQPACGDLTGAAPHCGTNASEINSGTLAAANGGAGSTSGILKANGAGVVSAASSSLDYAPPTTAPANLPLFSNGTGGFTNGSISGTGTELATFSGPATSARCLHTDASGNVTIAGTDCTAGTGGVPGYVNTPAVSAAGGNSTTTLLAQCSLAGCTDYENVVNGTNAGTLTISPPTTTMTNGALFWVYVKVGSTVPTDIFFSSPPPSGVAYQSYVLGLLASDLTSTVAGETAKRVASCGAPTANSVIAYQAWWDGANFNVTNCGSSAAAPYLGVALGGTQCGPAGPISTTLPAVPSTGARCMVTNANQCVAGTALNTGLTGSTPCEVVWNGSSWQPAGGAIAPAAGGFTSAGLGLTSSGSSVALATPVAATNGGAGTVSGILKANGLGTVSPAVANTDFQAPIPSATASPTLYLTGFTAPTTFTKRQPASTDLSDLPIPPLSGGSGCGQTNTLTFAGLPASPVFGTSCFITDCQTGVAGNVETGGGSTRCAVAWMGSNWIDGGLAQAAVNGGTGVNIQLTNATSGGTVVNRLASVNSSNSAIITPLGALSGIQGICTSGCGNSGTAVIQTQGSAACQFDGAAGPGTVTAGHYAAVNISPGTVAGECYDVGINPPGGVTLVGTIISPTATCTGASCGLFNVNLFGPDVTAAAGTALISTGVVGNPGVYSASNTVSPIPAVFHISGTNLTDQIFKVLTTQGKCMSTSNPPTPVACDVIVDPGTTDTETGPTQVGYNQCGAGCPNFQNLIIDNAKVIFSGGSASGSYPGPFPQDDGLIMGGNGRLECIGETSSPQLIGSASTAHLNSLVTTMGGVVLQAWRASTLMSRGEYIYDSASNTVQRILACAGGASTCTTGSGTTPAFSTTRWATTTDNQVTWQDINPGGRFSNTSVSVDMSGCAIYGNQLAQLNNTLRISGIIGANGLLRNMIAIGVGTGTGSDDTSGSDAILFDNTQGNGFCTGLGVPLACCSNPGAGQCQNSVASFSTGLITYQGLWSQPNGGITSCNPGYLVRFTGNATKIDIEGGQISDLGTSCAGANNLVADLDIDSGVSSVTFTNMYFESSATGHGPPDDIVTSGQNIVFNNVMLGGTGINNAGGLTNSLHIKSAPAASGFFRGGLPAVSSAVSAIRNDNTGFVLPSVAGTNGQPAVYNYGPATANYGHFFDGVPTTFLSGVEIPPGTLASCGTCNAAAEGTFCSYNNDAAGCGFSVVVTAGGNHHGMAECNQISTTPTYGWVMATCN